MLLPLVNLNYLEFDSRTFRRQLQFLKCWEARSKPQRAWGRGGGGTPDFKWQGWSKDFLGNFRFRDLFKWENMNYFLGSLIHRRTGNFRPGGAVNHLPKKFLQVAQIFTKQSKRNEGHMMQQHRPYWHMKVARYSFSGSIPAKFEHKLYVAINKHLEKLPPQLY